MKASKSWLVKDKQEEKMAGVERLELPTIGFGDRCSTNWNYTPATDSNYTDAQPKVKRKLLKNVNCLAVWRFNRQNRDSCECIVAKF